jgi:hypothetical protein
LRHILNFLFNLAVFAVPTAIAALGSTTLAKSSREEWKILAWVPVIPLAIWALFIAWGVTRDRTSHNLWPFELVIWSALSLMLFGGFLLGRRLLDRPPDDWRRRRDRPRQRLQG